MDQPLLYCSAPASIRGWGGGQLGPEHSGKSETCANCLPVWPPMGVTGLPSFLRGCICRRPHAHIAEAWGRGVGQCGGHSGSSVEHRDRAATQYDPYFAEQTKSGTRFCVCDSVTLLLGPRPFQAGASHPEPLRETALHWVSPAACLGREGSLSQDILATRQGSPKIAS